MTLLKALFVEASDDDTKLLSKELKRQGFEVEWQRVDTAKAFALALQGPWDVVISDYQLPNFTALQALQIAKKQDSDLPFIVVCGTVDEDVAVQVMRAGAHDFLTKGRLTRLGEAIRREIRDAQVRRERQSGIRQIEQLNRELKNSETKFRTLVENIDEVLYKVDARGILQYVSPAIKGLMGLSPSQAEGRPFLEWIHPDDRQKAIERFRLSPKEKQSSFECRVVTASGETRWITSSSTPQLHEGQEPSYLGIITDTTDQRRAVRVLRQNEARLNSIFDNSHDMISITDDKAQTIWANCAWMREFAANGEDLPDAFASVCERDLATINQAWAALVSQQRHIKGLEYRLEKQGGEPRILMSNAFPVTIEDQQRYCVVTRNIAPQKKLELERLEALREQHALLRATECILEKPTFHQAACEIFSICAEHIGATAGQLTLLNEEGTKASSKNVLLTACGNMPSIEDPTLPMAVYQLQVSAYNTKRAVFHNSLESTPFGDSVPQGQLALDNILLAPLVLKGQPVGLISLANKSGGFTKKDVAMAESFGKAAAVALRENQTKEQLRSNEQRFRSIFHSVTEGIVLAEPETGGIVMGNRALCKMLGRSRQEIAHLNLADIHPKEVFPAVKKSFAALARGDTHEGRDVQVVRKDGTTFFADISSTRVLFDGQFLLLACFRDITDRKDLETDLSHARKLEAVGQLSAGIAHEINTPTQFVGDSIHFLKDAFADLDELRQQYSAALVGLASQNGHANILDKIREAEEEADLEYLQEHIPGSFERCLDGLSRISTIVGAMKEFAHPDQQQQSSADINQALRSTLTIAKNEYKYISLVDTDFAEIPPVVCRVGDLNQVFLNLIVNAAHAIGDVVGDSGDKGTIGIRTYSQQDQVCIEISDSGSGIPQAVQDRVFDPFFTTKEVGKGSGQGLAISRAIVVDKHHGSLSFETAQGTGTTFLIQLPIAGCRSFEDKQ